MRLLVIEDDISIQLFLKRAMTEAGYQVDAAHLRLGTSCRVLVAPRLCHQKLTATTQQTLFWNLVRKRPGW